MHSALPLDVTWSSPNAHVQLQGAAGVGLDHLTLHQPDAGTQPND